MRALVVGSGVIGLRTALELLKRNINVVLRSAHPPLHPSTCSQGSGALWTPYKCDDVRVSGLWAMQTLDYLLTHQRDVEIVPVLHLKKTVTPELPVWTRDPRLSFEQLMVPEFYWKHKARLKLPKEDDVLEAGYTHVYFFHTPVVNAPRMLHKMFLEICNHPRMAQSSASDTEVSTMIHVDTGYTYSSMEDMAQNARLLGCSFIMNCTGLGSSKLCNDPSIQGGRGILLRYDRNSRTWLDSAPNTKQDVAIFVEDAPWASPDEACYIIPRGDDLLVGGSFRLVDSIDMEMRFTERQRLFKNAARLGIDTSRAKPVGEWIGHRPWRPTVRVEKELVISYDNPEGIPVIHNYGHGGSGWTVFMGAVNEAVNLALLK